MSTLSQILEGKTVTYLPKIKNSFFPITFVVASLTSALYTHWPTISLLRRASSPSRDQLNKSIVS